MAGSIGTAAAGFDEQPRVALVDLGTVAAAPAPTLAAPAATGTIDLGGILAAPATTPPAQGAATPAVVTVATAATPPTHGLIQLPSPSAEPVLAPAPGQPQVLAGGPNAQPTTAQPAGHDCVTHCATQQSAPAAGAQQTAAMSLRATTHRVERGETVEQIAAKHGLQPGELYAVNQARMAGPSNVYAGLRLFIPDRSGAVAPTPIQAPAAVSTAGAAAKPKPKPTPAPAPAPPPAASVPSRDKPTTAQIKEYLTWAGRQYGTRGDLLIEIAKRESSFVVDIVNNWDSNAANGIPSKGLMQFIEPTFNSYAAKAKAANPAAWKNLGPLNWMDWRQQALAASWAIKDGKGSAWATYADARRTVGA